VARTPSFQAIRERVIHASDPRATDTVADLGAGTGLLTLALAERVRSVWAIDRSRAMGEYVAAKAASAGHDNIRVVRASVTSIPLVDESVDLVVSSYCFHELSDPEKRRALAEAFRIAVPGGRVVIADMMFSPFGATARDRRVIGSKVRQLLALGAPGVVRLAKNGLRLATGRWERPVSPAWWERGLADVGFDDIRVAALEHEIGLAVARRPFRSLDGEDARARARSGEPESLGQGSAAPIQPALTRTQPENGARSHRRQGAADDPHPPGSTRWEELAGSGPGSPMAR